MQALAAEAPHAKPPQNTAYPRRCSPEARHTPTYEPTENSVMEPSVPQLRPLVPLVGDEDALDKLWDYLAQQWAESVWVMLRHGKLIRVFKSIDALVD